MLPRLKFQINDLVKEILDKLPTDVFKSSTTTFLDPAMAGGQFVVEVERRLRDNGHNDDNIAGRVCGLAEDSIDLKYAVITKKLIGKYSIGGIKQMEEWSKMGKKFDVIVGNPPYQAELKTLQTRLWMQFVDKAFELLKDNGYLAFVTPANWAVTPELYTKWFIHRNVLAINIDECGRHFPGIGIQFSYYVIQNAPNIGYLTQFISPTTSFNCTLPASTMGTDVDALPILQKVLWSGHRQLQNAYAPQTHYSYRKAGKVSDQETEEYKHKVMMSPSSSKKPAQWVWGKVICSKQVGPRVVVYTYPGTWRSMVVTDSLQTTHGFIHIPAVSMVEANNLKSFLSSKLITYIILATNSIRNINPRSVQQLPVVDFTHSWTDEELYNLFGLSKTEQKLIEDTVK